MNARTPEDATSLLCPLSRTFASKEASQGCKGPLCAVWRWKPLSAGDPRFTAALAVIARELGGGPHRTKEATAVLMADRAKYGVPTEPEVGFCGLGGTP